MSRSNMTRDEALARAQSLVSSERAEQYGSAEENFTRVARLWSAAFGWEVTLADVPLAIDLLKTARLISNPHHLDSWVDKAGYAALGAELYSEE
jgi:hypothetical protein